MRVSIIEHRDIVKCLDDVIMAILLDFIIVCESTFLLELVAERTEA